MTAQELINHMIPPLKMTDSAQKAMLWMEELRTNQLPVLDGSTFKGLITEELILENNEIDKDIATYDLTASACYVYDYQHFYDIIKMASNHNVRVVAVLDENNQYKGAITVKDTIAAFAQTAAVQSPGGIIVLSMNSIDYSLAEISRLIESNDAKILSSSLTNDLADPSKIKLTLKINQSDLSHVIATLERFEYKIIARFQEPANASTEKERLDILLKYLEI